MSALCSASHQLHIHPEHNQEWSKKGARVWYTAVCNPQVQYTMHRGCVIHRGCDTQHDTKQRGVIHSSHAEASHLSVSAIVDQVWLTLKRFLIIIFMGGPIYFGKYSAYWGDEGVWGGTTCLIHVAELPSRLSLSSSPSCSWAPTIKTEASIWIFRQIWGRITYYGYCIMVCCKTTALIATCWQDVKEGQWTVGLTKRNILFKHICQ